MEKILCFGDSNTYGFNPVDGSRYDEKTRWSGILKTLLKNKFIVVEEGCNNRTCYNNNPDGIKYSGYKILPQLLKDDFSIVILSIGINDLQILYKREDSDIKIGINNLINIIKNKKPNTKIILLSPSEINNKILSSYFNRMFDKTSIEISKRLSKIYEDTALNNKCKYINLNNYVKVSEIDGLHYLKEEHKKIAEILYKTIIESGLT